MTVTDFALWLALNLIAVPPAGMMEIQRVYAEYEQLHQAVMMLRSMN